MTIDTNIIIAYLSGELQVREILSQWQSMNLQLFLSTVAETEVLSFPKFTQEELQATLKFLEENFISIPFDREVARIAAKLRRDYRLKFPDAAIAATAIFTNTPLVTRNIRDFKRIPDLKIIKV
jgi:predicted nucleic acid-binding protein